MTDDPKERRQRERNACTAPNEHYGVIRVEGRCEAVRSINEHSNVLLGRSASSKSLCEAGMYVDQEGKLLPGLSVPVLLGKHPLQHVGRALTGAHRCDNDDYLCSNGAIPWWGGGYGGLVPR